MGSYSGDSTLSKVLSANHLQFVKHLGSGTYGDVMEIKSVRTGRKYAVKSTNGPASDQETLLWGSLRHENVLPLYQIVNIEEWKTLYVMPIMPRSLFQVIESPAFRVRADALVYIRQWLKGILSGLSYMHQNNYAHLDLKTDNVLISGDCRQAVLTDFSFVAHSKIPNRSFGSPSIYEPPEVYPARWSLTVDPESVDLWTTGMIAVETLTRHSISRSSSLPTPNDWLKHNYPMLSHILQENIFRENITTAYPNVTFNDSDFSQIRSFVFSLININPHNRCTAAQALNHQFLGGSYSSVPNQDLVSQMQSMQFASFMAEYHSNLDNRIVADPRLRPPQPTFPSWIQLDKEGRFVDELVSHDFLRPSLDAPFNVPQESPQETEEDQSWFKAFTLFIMLTSIAKSIPGVLLFLLSVPVNCLMHIGRKIHNLYLISSECLRYSVFRLFKPCTSIVPILNQIIASTVVKVQPAISRTSIAIAKIVILRIIFPFLMCILKTGIFTAYVITTILPIKKSILLLIVLQLKIIRKSLILKRKLKRHLTLKMFSFIKAIRFSKLVIMSHLSNISLVHLATSIARILITAASLLMLIKKTVPFKRPFLSTLKKCRSKFSSKFHFSVFNSVLVYFKSTTNNQITYSMANDPLTDELCQLFQDKLSITDSRR